MHIDLIFRGGQVVDGTGAPAVEADVGIHQGRIAFVGDSAQHTADRVIDVTGRCIAPGFIDVHSHDDAEVFRNPTMWPKTSQGVTSVVVGNCGVSAAPTAPVEKVNMGGDLFGPYTFARAADYIGRLEQSPAAVNVAMLVGHSTVRALVMDRLDREATPDEMRQMQEIVRQAMDDGAIGVSTGTAYPHAAAATVDEIVCACEPLRERNGIFTSHMRNEAEQQLQAIEEMGEIGRRLGVPIQISHHKCLGRPNHGKSVQTLKAIDALSREITLGFDVYPYIAGSTIILPERVKRAERTVIASCEKFPELIGREINELAAQRGETVDAVCQQIHPAFGVYFLMSEEDVTRIVSHDKSMIGSDGIPTQGESKPHPRLWGTFTRILGHYSRDLGLFTLEKAVHKMTGLPARHFGFEMRGEVHAGWHADLTVFDPLVVSDLATYDDPVRPSAGIDFVLVNGDIVVEQGAPTHARPGVPLRSRPLSAVRESGSP